MILSVIAGLFWGGYLFSDGDDVAISISISDVLNVDLSRVNFDYDFEPSVNDLIVFNYAGRTYIKFSDFDVVHFYGKSFDCLSYIGSYDECFSAGGYYILDSVPDAFSLEFVDDSSGYSIFVTLD